MAPRYGLLAAVFFVGRGPSHATRACERVSLAMPRHRGGMAPRYGLLAAVFFVGRGPSHATRACERVSLAIEGEL